jgi:hypothetical protein
MAGDSDVAAQAGQQARGRYGLTEAPARNRDRIGADPSADLRVGKAADLQIARIRWVSCILAVAATLCGRWFCDNM